MKRSYIKEGAVQLTALDSLLTSSRYFFLFSDLLLVAKQKAANSYKLKEKVRLDRIWLVSNDCPHSFLIGWPIYNFIAHFASEDQKQEWEVLLQQQILRSRARISPRFTTIPVSVLIDGRRQVMKKKIGISQTSNEILHELLHELSIPTEEDEVELSFDAGNGDSVTMLQGPECVFCIVMEHVKNTGYRLSDLQLEKIDALPLIQCRLVLASVGSTYSSTSSIVSHFKRVLSRSESRRFFGRPLEGSSPPQPVLTMIDHLMLHGVNVEGIFRKSPKQSTVRLLRAQLQRGSVPDFYQFNPHVTAALLKEYLREIPGKLLLSGNFELWSAAMEQTVDRQKAVRRLLQLLPSAHSTLLSKFFRLLRAITNSSQSKMTAQSLAVCIAPSLLENPKGDSATSWLPDLAEYLIINAPSLLEPFQDAQIAISSSVSNDSGLSDVDLCLEPSIGTLDSSLLGSPTSTCSLQSPQLASSKWKNRLMQTSSSRCFVRSMLTEGEEEEIDTEVEEEDYDKTPVLSRENSNVQNKPVTSVCRQKSSEDRGTVDEVPLRSPFISSYSCKKKSISKDENVSRRNIDWKIRREFGASPPCRRRIEGSPASIRRSEGSSPCKSMVLLDPGSPTSVRKSSTISTTSVRSDSTLKTSVSTDVPESPILLRRGSSKRADKSPVMQRKSINSINDSGIHFASRLSPRRKESENYELYSLSTKRIDQESNSQSHGTRRKELSLAQTRHDSFLRRHSENNTASGVTSNIRENVARKYSLPESKIWHMDDNAASAAVAAPCRNGEYIFQAEPYQMQMMTSSIFHPSCSSSSSSHNKFLTRRASERVNNTEAAISKLSSKLLTSKSDLKPNSFSATNINNNLLPCSNRDMALGSAVESNCNNESKVSSNNFRCISLSDSMKMAGMNSDRTKLKPIKQEREEEAEKLNGTVVKNNSQTRLALQKHNSSATISNNRIRKKTRTILMEPLEINWSVDEIRSKFQKDSEPPPFLNTIYSSYSLN
ncbi:unnamed protein product [Thelazia callipaeda]|uniref:Rho-GAP domain-containing protein n=1 Tax=Thelazia callipaeda TaxID=103827 RepID=A0A0N5CWL7_THECL|nr:unnamed protein product [Thelazia callipaeda]